MFEVVWALIITGYIIYELFVKNTDSEYENPYRNIDTSLDYLNKKGNKYMSTKEKEKYMKGEQWKALRILTRLRDGSKCRVCGSMRNLNCHHIHYDNLGNEELDDLVTLCENCHTKLHEELGYDRNGYYPIN